MNNEERIDWDTMFLRQIGFVDGPDEPRVHLSLVYGPYVQGHYPLKYTEYSFVTIDMTEKKFYIFGHEVVLIPNEDEIFQLQSQFKELGGPP